MSNPKIKVLVLSADKTDMQDSNGKSVQGTSVRYLFNADMKCVTNGLNSLGQKPAKDWAPLALFDKISHAPALYDAEFETKIGSDGKPVMRLVDLEFISFGEFKATIGSVTK